MSIALGLRGHARRNKEQPVPTLPIKDPRDIGPEANVKQYSIGLPGWLWKELDALGETTGYTRNELFREVMRQFIDETNAKSSGKKSSSK